jgi:hypothetical protein
MMRLFYLTSLLSAGLFAASIQEAESMQKVNGFLKSGDLIILDLDNTLMIPRQQLGSDQWFYHRIDHHLTQGLTRKQALKEALHEWHSVQAITKVLPCEASTADWVRRWQKEGRTVMGLTTRGVGMSQITIDQLTSLNINLDATAPHHGELFYLNPWGILFRQGIMFTAGTHKGKALGFLLDELQLNPSRIVFVNDKESHIQQLQETVDARNIPFLGLRYGAVDDWVASFNPAIADVQWEQFGHIISDEQAAKLLECRLNCQGF